MPSCGWRRSGLAALWCSATSPHSTISCPPSLRAPPTTGLVLLVMGHALNVTSAAVRRALYETVGVWGTELQDRCVKSFAART